MKPRIHILDILRGLLALSIMVYHYTLWTHFPWPVALEKVINKFGYFGVIWFFVISGFSLAYSYEKKDLQIGSKLINFYIKRFFRIAPLFAFASLMTVLTGHANWNLIQFFNNAFLTFPLYDYSSYIPTGGWSIGVEVLFYLIFPVLLFLLAKMGTRFFLIATVTISLIFLALSNQSTPVVLQGTLQFTPYYLMFFTAGMIMADFVIKKNNPFNRVFSIKNYLHLFIFLFLCFLFNWPKSGDSFFWFFIYEVFHDFLIIFSTYAAIKSLENTWISKNKLLRTLGDWSYSIYLLHPVIYYLWGTVTDRVLYVALLSVPSTFIASYFVYNYFELFIMKKSKNLKFKIH